MADATPACLSLGSNLGRRRATLAAALRALDGCDGIDVTACSSLYETEPVGLEGPLFLNLACVVVCSLTPEALHDACLQIEESLGRRRTVGLESRTVDIDIVFYGGVTLRAARLTLPHPRLAERRFVLEPLAEIVPAWRDPLSGKTVAELFAECGDPHNVRRAGGPPFP